MLWLAEDVMHVWNGLRRRRLLICWHHILSGILLSALMCSGCSLRGIRRALWWWKVCVEHRGMLLARRMFWMRNLLTLQRADVLRQPASGAGGFRWRNIHRGGAATSAAAWPQPSPQLRLLHLHLARLVGSVACVGTADAVSGIIGGCMHHASRRWRSERH